MENSTNDCQESTTNVDEKVTLDDIINKTIVTKVGSKHYEHMLNMIFVMEDEQRLGWRLTITNVDRTIKITFAIDHKDNNFVCDTCKLNMKFEPRELVHPFCYSDNPTLSEYIQAQKKHLDSLFYSLFYYNSVDILMTLENVLSP